MKDSLPTTNRTSINLYQKRVVELNLIKTVNDYSNNQSQDVIISCNATSQKINNCTENSKIQKLPNFQQYKSLNSSELPTNSIDISKNKEYYSKQKQLSPQNKNEGGASYVYESHQNGEQNSSLKKEQNQPTSNIKEYSVIPHNLFSSPRLSSGYLSSKSYKKHLGRKQINLYQCDKGSNQGIATSSSHTSLDLQNLLNNADQHQIASGLAMTQRNKDTLHKHMKLNSLTNQILSDNKTLQLNSYRSNSPKLHMGKILNKSSQKEKSYKGGQFKKTISSSNIKLLQNLSHEGRIRHSPSSTDFSSLKIQNFLGNNQQQQKINAKGSNNQFAQKTSITQRFYSPTAGMSLTKALSRISSVNELKKIKDTMEQSRKSIQNAYQSASLKLDKYERRTGCFSGEKSSKILEDSIRKQNNSNLKEVKVVEIEFNNKKDAAKQLKDCDLLNEDDNDYLTLQEKLWQAIETKQSFKTIQEMIKKQDEGEININQKNVFDDGWTCLHYAVHESYFDVIRLLVEEYSADIDARTIHNKTPFHFACRRGDESIIKYLLQKGANPNVVDRDGCTPLHYLCESQNIDMIQYLLPITPGSKDVRNRYGKKPIDLLTSEALRKVFKSNTSQSQSKKRQQQQTSLSRERSRTKNGEFSNIYVHKIYDQNEAPFSTISQLFKKFQHLRKQSLEPACNPNNNKSKERIKSTNNNNNNNNLTITAHAISLAGGNKCGVDSQNTTKNKINSSNSNINSQNTSKFNTQSQKYLKTLSTNAFQKKETLIKDYSTKNLNYNNLKNKINNNNNILTTSQSNKQLIPPLMNTVSNYTNGTISTSIAANMGQTRNCKNLNINQFNNKSSNSTTINQKQNNQKQQAKQYNSTSNKQQSTSINTNKVMFPVNQSSNSVPTSQQCQVQSSVALSPNSKVLSNKSSPNDKKQVYYGIAVTQKDKNIQQSSSKANSNQNSAKSIKQTPHLGGRNSNKSTQFEQQRKNLQQTVSTKSLQTILNSQNLSHCQSQQLHNDVNTNRIQNLTKQIDQVISQKSKDYQCSKKLAIQLDDDLDQIQAYKNMPQSATAASQSKPSQINKLLIHERKSSHNSQQIEGFKLSEKSYPDQNYQTSRLKQQNSNFSQQEDKKFNKEKEVKFTKKITNQQINTEESENDYIPKENDNLMSGGLFSSDKTGESSNIMSPLPNHHPSSNQSLIREKQQKLINEENQEKQVYQSDEIEVNQFIGKEKQQNQVFSRIGDSTIISSNNTTNLDQQQNKIGPWSFIAHQLLGTGSFGEVYLVEKISSGNFFAMKVLAKSKIMGHNLTRYALTERNVLSIQKHPFIVGLNYAFQTQEKLFLVLDYCSGGDLAEYLQLEKRFNEEKTRLYACEILLAIEELHRKDIIFRDLKPDNVVLDEEGHAKLTDFGLSKEGVLKEGMAKSFCGSYAYLAPEMLKKLGHGKAVDWYLLGVMIYEMLCGIPPYYANNKEDLFENIKNQILTIPNYVSPAAKDLIQKLLNRNVKKRMGTFNGADEIKKHPFFKGIDWEKVYRREYKPPEPYLKKRFENFLEMSPQMRTNTEVYEQLRRQAIQKLNFKGFTDEQHLQGWSFVSPQKQNE